LFPRSLAWSCTIRSSACASAPALARTWCKPCSFPRL
jgi:hypothetical protein